MVSDLAIIIVSYNARDDLDRCLRALHAAPPRVSHEIVVVDNGSSDGSPEVARAGWPGLRVIDAGGNLGFSRANNLGIRATSGRLILLLNSDTVTPPGAIDRLVAELETYPDAAVAGPRLVDARGRPEISFGRMMTPVSELRQKSLGRLYDAGVPVVVSWVRRWASRVHRPDWVSGACLLVRRADAERVGLLDERFFMYAEDVDFCASIRAAGRAVLFTPAAEVVHLRGRSARHAPAAAEQLYRLSQLAFYTKHHPRWVPWLRAYLRARGRLPHEATRTNSGT
ncbi:MAG: glycosyltransferase family 2 protein [Acidobacteria bacterium]|nr:glycosyltransferase family 2 protein [Acidobacteriota bacterium]